MAGDPIGVPYSVDRAGIDVFHGIASTLGSLLSMSGPCLTVNTACSSGATAVAVAAALLHDRLAPLALVCGVEELTEFSLVGFEMMGAYAPEPCAPFAAPDGLSLGEGAGALLLAHPDVDLGGTVPVASLAGWSLSSSPGWSSPRARDRWPRPSASGARC